MSEIFPPSEGLEPKKITKVLKHNNIWNAEGLLDSRTNNDGEVVVCSKTSKNLFFINENGSKIMLDSFGECATCNQVFHHSCLRFSDDQSNSSWPIQYEGRYCLDCYKKPLSSEELKEIQKIMR